MASHTHFLTGPAKAIGHTTQHADETSPTGGQMTLTAGHITPPGDQLTLMLGEMTLLAGQVT